MDDRSPSPPQSTSLTDTVMPPKRQKIDSPRSSSSSTSDTESVLGIEWETRRMRRELGALRIKLFQTEATVIQHHNLRKQTEELLTKEKNILEMQIARDKETIEQLEEDLETAVRRANESLKSQEAAESKVSKIRSTMKKNSRLQNTSIECTSEGVSSSQEFQEIYRETLEKLKAAHQKIKELEAELEKNSVSQAELDLKTSKLEKAKITIHRMNSANRNAIEREKLATSRIRELEEEVESGKEKIAMLVEVVTEKVCANEKLEQQLVVNEEKSKSIEKLTAQVMMLRGRCQEFSFKLHKCKKEEGVTEEASKEGSGSETVEVAVQTDVEQSKAQGDNQQKEQNQQNQMDKVPRKTREAKKKSGEMTRRNIEEFNDVQSVVNGPGSDERDPSWNEPGDEFSSDSQSDFESVSQADEEDYVKRRTTWAKRADGDLRVEVGKKYHVLASSSEFFGIQWQYEYRHRTPRKYVCKKCDAVENTRNKIEDHVWVEHYDGSFKCPLCTGRQRNILRRDSIREHVKRAHPESHHVLGVKK